MRSWQSSLIVALAYLVTGYTGLMMPAIGTSVSLIWLPTGIAVAALRRWGFRCWWGVALGAISVNLAIGNPFLLACGIAVGNTLGPLLATLILVRTGFSLQLKRSRDILLLSGAAAVGMLVSATVGVFCLSMAGSLTDGHALAWLIWWAGDTTGAIAAAPLLFVLNRAEIHALLRRRAELGIWAATIVAAGLGVFVFNTGVQRPPLPIAFIPLPLILWGAMRYGPIGTSFGIIVLSLCATFGAASGSGLFSRSAPTEGLALIWLFMITCVILGWMVSVLDSTKVRAFETARQLERALEEASLGFLLADADRRITHVGGDFTRLTGYSATEILGRSCRILQGPETDPSVVDKLRSSLTCARIFDDDLLNYRKDGTTFWNGLLISPIHDVHGELSGFIGIQRDVTERKSVQAALARSEERLRENRDRLNFLMSSSPTVIYTASPTGEFPATFVSANVHSQLGYEPQQFTSDPGFWASRIHPDDAARVRVELAALFEHDHHSYEYRFRSSSGDYRWMHDEMLLKRDAAGNPMEIVGYWSDVTVRYMAELSLKESEARYRQMFKSNPQPMWVYDLETLAFLAVNDAAIAKYGYSRDEFLALTIKDIRPPEDVAALLDNVASIANGLDEAGVWRHQLKNGQLIWVRITSHTLTFNGRPAEVVLAQDVTDQLQAEESLRASEELFRQAFEYSAVGMALVSPDGQFLRVNASLQSILGYTEAELLQTTCVAVTAPEDRAADKQWVEPMLAGRMDRHSTEKRYIRSDGSVVWVLLTVSIVRDKAHRPVNFVAQFQDVTARRVAELAVRESEEKLRIFVENAPAGVAMLDRELRYISYSRRWLTDYGLGKQHLVGRSHYEVFPEITDRWKAIHRRCLTGVSEFCEQDRFDRGDGSASYLRWEIQPWYDATGAVGGLVFFTELITDRINAEEQIKASLREKESLLKEVHHRVKNNLQIITSLLNLQAETVQDPTTLKLLRESQNRVRSMALVHETLYRSGDLGWIDFGTYVDAICSYLSRAYGIDNYRIHIEVHVDQISLDLDRAIPCGLIINELVSNALKYAFPENRSGRITVQLTSNSDQNYTLAVEDDGVGLPPDLDLGKIKSLGLQLVSDLVRQLNGSIVIATAPRAGFFIRFPAQFPQAQRP
ncbi:MAG: PAS domain S-box protein [Pirellulaceae bacterium]|nr:PAS domain S-box protein [Pirellulaceae bacterium]